MNDDLIESVLSIAREGAPEEVCGLLVQIDGDVVPLSAKNLSHEPKRSFYMDPTAWLSAREAGGEVIGVFHSHPDRSPKPSMPDRQQCEATGLPWLIVSPHTGRHEWLEPEGFKAPLVRRPFAWGVFDCSTLLRDYYEYTLGLTIWIPEGYAWRFWKERPAPRVFESAIERNDVVAIPKEEIRLHDMIFMRLASYHVINHCGMYLGNGELLHHMVDCLSGAGVYDERLRRATVMVCRCASMMQDGDLFYTSEGTHVHRP